MSSRVTSLALAMIAVIGSSILHAHAQDPENRQPGEGSVKELMRELQAHKMERKADFEKELRGASKRLKPLLAFSVEDLQLALMLKVRERFEGARVLSDESEPRFLGTVTDEFDPSSVFNEFGMHGSEFAAGSIWNEFGIYGGEFSMHSPFNSFSLTPPFLLKGEKVIGRLTVNRFVSGAVDPIWLKSFYTY